MENIRALLNDIENDRVERTISTTNTDKFGQAICAFANDLPNHQQPGYLFLGVKDDGTVQGLDVTDDLLKNISAIRTDGNIQPQPSMVVEKVSLEEGDIVMVKVQPSVFPPVRYKGRTWVRVGPRKGVANETDEQILMVLGGDDDGTHACFFGQGNNLISIELNWIKFQSCVSIPVAENTGKRLDLFAIAESDGLAVIYTSICGIKSEMDEHGILVLVPLVICLLCNLCRCTDAYESHHQ